MSRQLATMISSGMTLLRAFYVLEEQIENQMLRETIGAVREDIEAGSNFSDALETPPEGLQPALRRDGARRRGRRRARGVARAGRRPAREGRRAAPPGQVRDGLPDRRAQRSRMVVLIGMIAFIVPVFVGVFKDFGGELPLITQLHGEPLRQCVTGQWYILIAVAVGGIIGFKKWKTSSWGRAAVGPVPPADPVQDRQDRPEDRARALVAHVLGALRRRRADHARDRGDRPDRRQHGRRPRDGRRHRVGQVRRLDRRPAQARPRSSRRWSRR